MSSAVDNQMFVAMCSVARNPEASYQAVSPVLEAEADSQYGHSLVVNPIGQVIVEAGEGPETETIYADIGMSSCRDKY